MVGSARSLFMLGASSDIGRDLCERFDSLGYSVAGTFRKASNHEFFEKHGNRFFQCDISDSVQVRQAADQFAQLDSPWTTLISSVGQMKPIGPFFEQDFDEWENTVKINTTAQLRALHTLYPLRKKDEVCHVVFFAGGGTNNAFSNYSAYCASKIFLIKMCELLDDEAPDLNVFIVGPGWVKTKIHSETVEAGSNAGINFSKTQEFISQGEQGTPMEDIFNFIQWGIESGRNVTGGRNWSVVHDAWKDGGKKLSEKAKLDTDFYKLRRFGNEWRG